MNNHSYPFFKKEKRKENYNHVYLNAICLPEYKIQMVLSPSAEVLQAEDGCPAGGGPTGSCKHNLLQPFAMPLRSMGD